MIEWGIEFDLGELPRPPRSGSAEQWDRFWATALDRAQHQGDPAETLHRCRLGAAGFYAAEWYDRMDTLWDAGLRSVLFPGCGLRLLPQFCQRSGFDVTAVDFSRVALDFAQAHPAEPWEWEEFCAAPVIERSDLEDAEEEVDPVASRKRQERAVRDGGRLHYITGTLLDLQVRSGELDILVLQNILQALSDNECRDLLCRADKWLRPGGVIVIDHHGMDIPYETIANAASDQLRALDFHLQPHFGQPEFEPYDPEQDETGEKEEAAYLARYQRYRAEIIRRSRAGERIVLFQHSGWPVPVET